MSNFKKYIRKNYFAIAADSRFQEYYMSSINFNKKSNLFEFRRSYPTRKIFIFPFSKRYAISNEDNLTNKYE